MYPLWHIGSISADIFERTFLWIFRYINSFPSCRYNCRGACRVENRYISKIWFSIKLERNLAHFSFGFRVDARTTSTLGGKQFYYTSNNYIAVNIVVTPTVFPNCYRPARNHFQFSSLRFIEDKFVEVLPLIILNIKSNFSKFDDFYLRLLFHSQSIPPIYTLRQYYYPSLQTRTSNRSIVRVPTIRQS